MHTPDEIAAKLLAVPYGALDERARKVARHIAGRMHIARNVAEEFDAQPTPGPSGGRGGIFRRFLDLRRTLRRCHAALGKPQRLPSDAPPKDLRSLPLHPAQSVPLHAG